MYEVFSGYFLLTHIVITRPSRFVLSTEGKGAEDRVWNELVEIWYNVNPKTADIMA